jgi:hypothetical protein
MNTMQTAYARAICFSTAFQVRSQFPLRLCQFAGTSKLFTAANRVSATAIRCVQWRAAVRGERRNVVRVIAVLHSPPTMHTCASMRCCVQPRRQSSSAIRHCPPHPFRIDFLQARVGTMAIRPTNVRVCFALDACPASRLCVVAVSFAVPRKKALGHHVACPAARLVIGDEARLPVPRINAANVREGAPQHQPRTAAFYSPRHLRLHIDVSRRALALSHCSHEPASPLCPGRLTCERTRTLAAAPTAHGLTRPRLAAPSRPSNL